MTGMMTSQSAFCSFTAAARPGLKERDNAAGSVVSRVRAGQRAAAGSQSSWHPPPPGYHTDCRRWTRNVFYRLRHQKVRGEKAPLVTAALGASGVALYHSICQQQVQTKHWTAPFHGSPRWPALTGDAEERLLKAEIGREAAVTWSSSIVELHPEWRIRSTIHIWPCNAVLVLSSSWRPRAG